MPVIQLARDVKFLFFFAGVNESFYMGDLMEGTYCSRIFSNCDQKRCVLQSPNYPGLYPRNLTCYYAIRQHAIPYGRQALISITQPYSRLVSIKTDRTNPEGTDPKPIERKVSVRVNVHTKICVKYICGSVSVCVFHPCMDRVDYYCSPLEYKFISRN